jgi:hypothetical protein
MKKKVIITQEHFHHFLEPITSGYVFVFGPMVEANFQLVRLMRDNGFKQSHLNSKWFSKKLKNCQVDRTEIDSLIDNLVFCEQ